LLFFCPFLEILMYIYCEMYLGNGGFMNKLAKIAAVSAFAFTASQAAWEWTLADDGGQVESGGYWFGYDDKDEKGTNGTGGCTTNNFPPGSTTEDIVSGPWRELGGKITYTFRSTCTYIYPFAGIGFNFFDPKMTISDYEDPFPGATGITLYYELTTSTGIECVVELGADEATKVSDYNNYVATLTTGDQSAGKTFPFTGFGQTYGTKTPWAQIYPKADSFKFKCQGKDEKTAGTAELNIKRISINSNSSPIIGGKPTQSGVSFAMEGRMLSVSVTKATAVQVYNMQGAVVKTQTLTPEIKTINLSNMPAGIYMVSAPSLGYTGKIMLK
jgi:hypothetical protein